MNKKRQTIFELISKYGLSFVVLLFSSTSYWVASRCLTIAQDRCLFLVRYVSSGEVYGNYMYYSDDFAPVVDSLALFPVVTLSSELLKPGTETDFAVQL